MSRPPAIRDDLEHVLADYVAARASERFGKASAVWQTLARLGDRFAASDAVRAFSRIQVKASAGQGSWAHIPWIAFLHLDETDTTRRGIYVIYLFRADMTGVYLTLNQGVTEPLKAHGPVEGIHRLRERASQLRPRVAKLADHGFSLDDGIDLRGTLPAAQHYTASTIAHKLYERGLLPGDHDLLADLSVALEQYASLLAA